MNTKFLILILFICAAPIIADNTVPISDMFCKNRIAEIVFEKNMAEDFSNAKSVYQKMISEDSLTVKMQNNIITVFFEGQKYEIEDSLSSEMISRTPVGSNVSYAPFIEARVRKADSFPSSAACIVGKFVSADYQKLGARHVVYRSYSFQSMEPSYDFYHISQWPVVSGFENGSNIELTNATNEVLIDARRFYYSEEIRIYKTDAKDTTINIDSSPFMVLGSKASEILRVELPAGFYGFCTKRYPRPVNEGNLLFNRLHKGFTVQY